MSTGQSPPSPSPVWCVCVCVCVCVRAPEKEMVREPRVAHRRCCFAVTAQSLILDERASTWLPLLLLPARLFTSSTIAPSSLVSLRTLSFSSSTTADSVLFPQRLQLGVFSPVSLSLSLSFCVCSSGNICQKTKKKNNKQMNLK